jgi:DNA-binding protein H-NS
VYLQNYFYCVTEENLFDQLEELLGQYELSPELHKIGLSALDELAKKETAERDDIQNLQFNSVKDVQKQLDNLLDMATKEMITSDEYLEKSKSLKERLAVLNKEQEDTATRARNWYEIVGTTLGEIVNANERFANGDILTKKHILQSIGQNPVLTDGKLTLDEFYWLQPIKKKAGKLTEELNKIRTEPQRTQKASFEAVCQS